MGEKEEQNSQRRMYEEGVKEAEEEDRRMLMRNWRGGGEE
jgi:hypothetical protein